MSDKRFEITTKKVPALIQVPMRRVFGPQPINRVRGVNGEPDWLIWPDGVSRPMTRRERLRMWLRLPLNPERPSYAELQKFVNTRVEQAALFGTKSKRRGG